MIVKYTTDGRKVIVIGSLNSQEKIVQEVFIVDGSEIPSGEHFVVKSLHDAPAVSWKEKELSRIEREYEETKTRYDRELKSLNTRFRDISNELRNKIEYAGKTLKNVSPRTFDTFVDYLTGRIKYIVMYAYDCELIEWKDFKQNYEDKLRLISIYGNDDGTMIHYAINEYYDDSGRNDKFVPFNNYDDAFAFLKSKLLEKTISDSVIKTAKKYNIELPVEKVREYYKEEIASLTKNVERNNADIIKWKNQIAATKDTLDAIELEEKNNSHA